MFKKIHRELKKESCRKIGNGFLVMALICCLMFVSYQATSAVITSAKVGDRELPIYCVDTDKQRIALTFDTAWGNEDIPQILKILKQENVKATFFFCGDWISKYPADIKTIYEEGHDIASHGDYHKYMTKLTDKQLSAALLKVLIA